MEPFPLQTLSLIGLPGAGKTSIGRRLARALDTSFVDLDRKIEAVLGCSISIYFREQGEVKFREVETRVLCDTLENGVGVLSTGGGTVLREENRELLRHHTRVIFLDADPCQLVERVRCSELRPLFHGVDPMQRMNQLHAARDGLYRATAHCIVPAGKGSLSGVVHRIVDFL